MIYFQNGAMEILTNPLALLLIVALSLSLGQQKKIRQGLSILFLVTVMLGLYVARMRWLGSHDYGLWILIWSGLFALSTVLYLTIPLTLNILLVGISGMLLGLYAKPFLLPGFLSFKLYSTYAGVAITAAVTLSVIVVLSLLLQRFWQGVLVRVLASWVLASALMVWVLTATKTIAL